MTYMHSNSPVVHVSHSTILSRSLFSIFISLQQVFVLITLLLFCHRDTMYLARNMICSDNGFRHTLREDPDTHGKS